MLSTINMLFHKMLTSIIANVIFIILVNNVYTQNNKTTSRFITEVAKREQRPFADAMAYDEAIPKKKKYDLDKIDSLFEQHARHVYGIDNPNETEVHKYYITFKENIMIINYLNNFYNTATFSINAYTHFKFDDFTKWFTGFNSTGITDDDVILFNRSVVQDFPPKMDWSDGILNNLFQETKCKNSYVLSALSNIEARYFASNGNMKVEPLSIRQAFECERQGSCEYGGVPHYVFQALKNTGGVSLMYMYPYFEQPDKKGDKCQTEQDKVIMVIDHYIRLKVDKEEDLLYLLAYYGPVVTTIFVSESIRHYSRGVLDPGDCGNNATNHAVLLDGYGIDDVYHLPYWHVKGTWTEWGDQVHIRLIRGKGFVCNLGREYIATAFVKPKIHFE